MILRSIIIILLLFPATFAISQNKLEQAAELKNRAIHLMDSGSIESSIVLLNKAKKLDPENYAYEYEIGYAHYLNRDMKASLDSYKKVIKYKNITDQCYQMLGNLYDINGYPKKALKVYEKGLNKFPGSGRLYLETGNVYWNQKLYDQALSFYELGIQLDPAYPSNYYRATLIYCASDQEVWGMIYGEIFMNLERNTARTSEISKLLFDTYKSQIQYSSDTSWTVSFCKNHNIVISTKQLKKNPEALVDQLILPWGMSVYEPTLILSMIGQDTIDLQSLNQIRSNFITNYYDNKHHEKYPLSIFEYNRRLMDINLLEAYNYWILMKGDEESFDNWEAQNEQMWQNFVDWFTENPLFINDVNKFYKGMFQ